MDYKTLQDFVTQSIGILGIMFVLAYLGLLTTVVVYLWGLSARQMHGEVRIVAVQIFGLCIVTTVVIFCTAFITASIVGGLELKGNAHHFPETAVFREIIAAMLAIGLPLVTIWVAYHPIRWVIVTVKRCVAVIREDMI